MGAHFRVPVLPVGEVGQRRASATCVDFFMPIAFGVSPPSSALWPWSGLETWNFRTRPPSPRVNMEGRIVASDVASIVSFIRCIIAVFALAHF